MNLILVQAITTIITLIIGIVICSDSSKKLNDIKSKLELSRQTSKNLELIFYKEIGEKKEK